MERHRELNELDDWLVQLCIIVMLVLVDMCIV